jgi:hypothetical protein
MERYPRVSKSVVVHLSQSRIVLLAILATCLTVVPQTTAQQPPQMATVPTQSAPEVGQPQENVPPPSEQIVPSALTIPAGTFITVRLMGQLSSEQNQAGDGFSATLEQPIVANGWVIARKGQIVIGRVVVAQKAHYGRGTSRLGVALSDMVLVDGQQLPLQTQLVQTSDGTSSKVQDATVVGATTGIGSLIGAAAGGGTGAGIGAAAGATAGLVGVLITPGRPTIMPAETLLTFRLESPLTIDTQNSQQAFHPVTQEDYARAAGEDQRQRAVVPAYPPPPPYYYPPCFGGWGFYPAVAFVGFYGGPGYGHYGGHWH